MLESKKYGLKTITDIHIGSGDKLYKFDYVINEWKMYIVSEEKLGEEIELDTLNDLIFGMKNDTYPNLYSFLEKNGLLNTDFLEKVSLYKIPVGTAKFPENEILPFIKDSFKEPYIPGSSIKGALRTAFLYSVIKMKEKEYINNYVKKRIEELENDRRKTKKGFRHEFAKYLERDYLQKFNLSQSKKYDPLTDIFRVLKVSDTKSLSQDSLCLKEVKVFSPPRGEKNWSIFVEALSKNSATEFSITVDWGIFNDFSKSNKEIKGIPIEKYNEFFKDPIKILGDFTNDLIKSEKKYFQQYGLSFQIPQDENKPNARIGFGTGMLGNTVDLLMDNETRKKIRDTFGQRREQLAPKSRRIESDTKEGLGWVQITPIR